MFVRCISIFVNVLCEIRTLSVRVCAFSISCHFSLRRRCVWSPLSTSSSDNFLLSVSLKRKKCSFGSYEHKYKQNVSIRFLRWGEWRKCALSENVLDNGQIILVQAQEIARIKLDRRSIDYMVSEGNRRKKKDFVMIGWRKKVRWWCFLGEQGYNPFL